MTNTIIVVGDGDTGSLPYILEPEDSGAWQNPDGEIRMGEILIAIVKAGYPGIRIEVLKNTPGEKSLWILRYNTETPEGLLAKDLYMFAKAGSKLIPVDEALSILERVYREEGLPLPTNKDAR